MKYLMAAILLCTALCHVTAGSAQYDDDKYVMDKEYARELAQWILQGVQREPIYAQKRNSEIINSLLGLPKVMNDAGRK